MFSVADGSTSGPILRRGDPRLLRPRGWNEWIRALWRRRGAHAKTATKENDVKFMCLAYEEEATLNALSPSEWDALRDETIAYVDTLRKSGHLITTYALQSTRTAATVR